MAEISPVRTPSPSRFNSKGIFDSPFSDYHTDTSPVHYPSARFTSPFQQKLLSRLNRIGTQVLRRTLSDDASKDIEVGLDALENRIQAPEVKSKESADVADSGLFVDDEEEQAGEEEQDEGVYDSQDDSSVGTGDEMAKSRNGLGLRMSSSPDEEFLESPLGSAKGPLANKVVLDAEEAAALVTRVTKVASELRQRYEEVRHLNDQMVGRLETASNEVLNLRSENEALRADLSFDHSELLFLKLQLKAVQLSIEPQLPGDGQYATSVDKSLTEGLERWKKDWKDVDLKFQARRAKYGMAEPPADLTSDGATPANETSTPESKEKKPLAELRLPTKIISIRRPNAPRSFTSSPAKHVSPSPAEPPTPDLTSGSEDGDENTARDKESRVEAAVPNLPNTFTSSTAMTYESLSSDEDEHEGDVSDDDEAYVDDDESEDEQDVHVRATRSRVTTTKHDLVDESDEEVEEDYDEDGEIYDDSDSDSASPHVARVVKTPWQELWDGLTEYAGILPDDD